MLSAFYVVDAIRGKKKYIEKMRKKRETQDAWMRIRFIAVRIAVLWNRKICNATIHTIDHAVRCTWKFSLFIYLSGIPVQWNIFLFLFCSFILFLLFNFFLNIFVIHSPNHSSSSSSSHCHSDLIIVASWFNS